MEELKAVRKDLMYAMDNNDKILLGLAINRLDTLIYKQGQALPIDSASSLLTVKEVLAILDDSAHLADAKTLIRETSIKY